MCLYVSCGFCGAEFMMVPHGFMEQRAYQALARVCSYSGEKCRWARSSWWEYHVTTFGWLPPGPFPLSLILPSCLAVYGINRQIDYIHAPVPESSRHSNAKALLVMLFLWLVDEYRNIYSYITSTPKKCIKHIQTSQLMRTIWIYLNNENWS